MRIFSQMAASTTLTVTATSSSSAVATTSTYLLLQNSGSKVCYVALGAGSVTALTTYLPVMNAETLLIAKSSAHGTVAAICGGSDSTTLHVTPVHVMSS